MLAAIAFADSSFLLIPPDLLLVPMALVRPKQIWTLSLICTVASSLGAVVGYLIGYGLWSLVGVPLVELYGYGNGFAAYQQLIEKWGVWIIIAKSLTPVPFKIMAIAAGVAAMSPMAFLASAVVGRALHFAIVATLIALWGDRVMVLLSRYGRALAIISLLDRDRGTPRGATPPTPPGIRVTYHGGSTGLSLDRDIESRETE